MKGGKNGQNGTKKGAGSPSLWRRIRRQARAHRATFFVYAALRLTVLAALVFAVAAGHWTTAFFCVLTLLLFLAPFLAEESFRIELPSALEIVILLFIFCSEMLGEAAAFYVNVPLWDSLLHLVNGFLCAAVGFALAELMNRRRRKPNLSPLFLAVVAFSFSMTVGALWEFFEFFMDAVFHTDMQKDFLVDAVRSVLLDESRKNIVVSVENIARTVLYDAEGNVLAVIEGGFLDVGVIDTMKDLILNFVGALVFSALGYFYVLRRGKSRFAGQFIPTAADPEPSKPPEQAAQKEIRPDDGAGSEGGKK